MDNLNAKIIAYIEQRGRTGQKTIMGFDVFDTLITRIYPKEQSFEVMCRAIAVRCDGKPDRYSDVMTAYNEIYRKSCIENEKAGFDYEAETETLFEGWVELLLERGFDLNRPTLENIIVEIETALMLPIKYAVDLLRSLNERGVPCVYVSDMYLGRKIVDRILSDMGMLSYFEQGFVSSDHCLLKRTGNLYPHVLNVLGIAHDEFVFAGDDKTADYIQPKSQGIYAFQYLTNELEQERRELRVIFDKVGSSRPALVEATVNAASGPAFEHTSIESFSVAKYLGLYYSSFALWIHSNYWTHFYHHRSDKSEHRTCLTWNRMDSVVFNSINS